MLEMITVAQHASSMPLVVPELTETSSSFFPDPLEKDWPEAQTYSATSPAALSRAHQGLWYIIDGKPFLVQVQTTPVGKAYGSLTPSTCEQLEEIKTRLGISVTQLAELLGVTRKAIYDWYDGAEPRALMLGRIQSLAEAIAKFKEIDLKRLKAVWSIATPSGSFRSTLQNATLAGPDLTAALVARLNELSEEMDSPTRSPKRASIVPGEAYLADIDRRSDSF